MFRGGDDTKSNGRPQEADCKKKKLDANAETRKRRRAGHRPALRGEILPGQPAGAGAVDPRTTNSGSNSNSSGATPLPSIWLTSRSTAAWPIISIGWRTVVSGGSVQVISA